MLFLHDVFLSGGEQVLRRSDRVFYAIPPRQSNRQCQRSRTIVALCFLVDLFSAMIAPFFSLNVFHPDSLASLENFPS
ncbi:MAG TPA: hypothetical protein DEB25_03845 [Desulfobulbaceae bacterium]|nr:hypothetical protein [Desulfobulbaceae bacterium]